jgi:8-oxo-dGTP pyrophosphatase MutT (NUDIX family)
MVREISAGGVVVKKATAGWMMAVIEPQREADGDKRVLALPKGLVDPGEKPEQTAVREVLEETGLTAIPVTKLADIKYVYVRSWGDKQRVFKIVSFYLLKYRSGKIGEIAPEMRSEVERAFWAPLEGAEKQLAYRGEREVAARAREYIRAHPDL